MVLWFINQIQTNIVTWVESLLGLGLGIYATIIAFSKVSSFYRKFKIRKGMKSFSEVNKILREARERTLADRISLFEFHNGGKNIVGHSFSKLTCTNEVVRSGQTHLIDRYQNIHLGVMSPWILPLIEGKVLIIKDVAELSNTKTEDGVALKEDPFAVKNFLTKEKVKAILAFPIYIDDELTGYFSVVYNRKINWDAKNLVDEDNQFDKVYAEALQLKGAIEYKLSEINKKNFFGF